MILMAFIAHVKNHLIYGLLQTSWTCPIRYRRAWRRPWRSTPPVNHSAPATTSTLRYSVGLAKAQRGNADARIESSA